MALFASKPSPTDQLIRELREERDHLRARTRELEQQLLALTDRAAYRVVHPNSTPPAMTGPLTPDLFASRNTPMRPEYTMESLKRDLNEGPHE